MGLGVLAWGLGLLYYTLVQWDLETIPVPSLADAGYLMVYPPVYAALVLLYRSRIRGRSGALWIDGAIGALAVGAIGAAVVFDAVLESVGGAGLAAATNLSYPLADVVMLGLVVGVLAMTGWRRAGAWGWIAGGLAMFAVSDSLYFYGIALGTYEEGVIYDAGWPAAVLLLAYGAWTPASPLRAEAARARREILLPIVFAGASLGLLIYDHFDPTNVLALALASSCLVAVLDAARGHPRRQPQDARRQPRGGLHRRAHRARQPPLADARARARGRRGDRGAPRLPRDLRSRRLQGLQRRLRPPRRRLPPHPPERRAARVRRGPRRRLPDGRRRVLRARVARGRRRRPAARRGRRGAQRARRRLHDHLLLRQGRAADGGRRRRARAPRRRPAHVPAEERRPRVGRAPVQRRAAARAGGAPSLARRPRPRRRGAGRRDRRAARPAARGARGPAPGRGAPRHGQGRHPRRDPRQAGPAGRRTSGSSCAATRSSASASCRPRRRSSASPRSCARPTSGWTARATPTGWPARRSRSPRGSCSCATPSRR